MLTTGSLVTVATPSHEDTVTTALPLNDTATVIDERFVTPVRRPPSIKSAVANTTKSSGGKHSAKLALDFDALVPTIDTTDVKKKRRVSLGVSGSAASALLSSAVASVPKAPSTEPSNKRKRKSVGAAAAVDAPNSSFLASSASSTASSLPKKRASRLSIGTPGKATLLDASREQDVAKRFIELEVTEAYKAIRKQTGALGGNAAGGAIYGEITQASFQRVVDYMKEHCELSTASLFLDVGSGLGKPNFHVAIDPGVEVSYGIELEELRWHLSLHNLRSVLQLESQRLGVTTKRNRTMFTAGDITDATTLNPFSHVYSFDVGFPPGVMDDLALTFNRSSTTKYFVSFHAPRKVVDLYGFDVESIGRVATSMAGSSEGHTCYFYRRVAPIDRVDGATSGDESEPVAAVEPSRASAKATRKSPRTAADNKDNKDDKVDVVDGDARLLHIDPLFRAGFDVVNRGRDGTLAWIESFFGNKVNSGRTRGQKAIAATTTPTRLVERPLESYYRVVGKARVAEVDAAAVITKKKLDL